MKKKTEWVIFDLDGTLVDTAGDLVYSANQMLNQFNLPPITENECKMLTGEGIKTLVSKALTLALWKKNGKKLDIDKLPDMATLEKFSRERRISKNDLISEGVRKMESVYNCHFTDFSKPYPGIIELLDYCSSNALILSVLSNKPQFFVRKMIDYYFPKYNFFPIIGGQESLPLKPSKKLIPFIKESLDHSENYRKHSFLKSPDWNQKTLLIGDSEIDILTGKNNNILTGFVSWGFRTLSHLEKFKLKPDYIFNSVREIIDIL